MSEPDIKLRNLHIDTSYSPYANLSSTSKVTGTLLKAESADITFLGHKV